MPGDFERQLIREIREQSRSAFDEAVRVTGSEFVTAGNVPGTFDGVPLDTGFLRENWRTSNRSVTSNILRITVTVMARGDNGADYAAILHKARRIQPRSDNPRGLIFFQPPGSPNVIASRGFDNRWFNWWEIWWGGLNDQSVRWIDNVQTALDRSFTR